MSKNQYKSAVTGFLILLIFAIGCTKIDTTSLGQDLIPSVDNIHTFDTTFNVIAINYDNIAQCDTVHRNDLQALGLISNDPYFGKTNAAIYVEMKPSYFPYNFPVASPDSLVVDSAVLVLKYSYSFGDTNALQKINVYQLSDSFKVGNNYTSCTALGFDNSVLYGTKTFYPYQLKDSVHALKEEASSQLRIPILTSLAQSMITDSAGIFRTDQNFVDFFKGFAIVADQNFPGQQALSYFDLTSASSRLAIYVRATNKGVTDTTVISFGVSGLTGQANSVIHDRGTSEITAHLNHPAQGDSLVYIQTSPGSYALLTIPGLTGLSNRVINRAELIVDQEYSPNSYNDIFNAPVNLYIDAKDPGISPDSYIPLPCDFTSTELQSNFATMGGGLKQAKDNMGNNIGEYVFNISRYLQSIVTKGKTSLTLRLSAPNYVNYTSTYTDWCGQGIIPISFVRNNIGNGRVKLNGSNNTPTRMRLHIVYSVL
ncbi:MAG: DUF4270 family protein [Ginsengibacter sp.]